MYKELSRSEAVEAGIIDDLREDHDEKVRNEALGFTFPVYITYSASIEATRCADDHRLGLVGFLRALRGSSLDPMEGPVPFELAGRDDLKAKLWCICEINGEGLALTVMCEDEYEHAETSGRIWRRDITRQMEANHEAP